MLFGLSPFDPVAYVGVSLLLATVALAATYLPAGRASKSRSDGGRFVTNDCGFED
jgi:hypothetical protein